MGRVRLNKRGPIGAQGSKGGTGERGVPGATGPAGPAGLAAVGGTVTGEQIASHVEAPGPARDALDKIYVEAVSPLSYGGAGDGSGNDTTPLQDSFDDAGGRVVDLRGLTWKTTDQVNVPAGTTIRNGTIHCTGTGKKILNVLGDNVTLQNVTIRGRHAGTTTAVDEHAIYAEGASAADPILNLTVEDCTIEHVGMHGVFTKYVTGFRFNRNKIRHIGYGAIMCLSSWNGQTIGNEIIDVLAGFGSSGYGISMSRDETDSLVDDPRCSDVIITHNYVTDIPWEGIGTHGGERLTISNNTVLRCRIGVAIGEVDDSTNLPHWAPQDCTVANNIIDSGVTDGSQLQGIGVTGVATILGSSGERATGIRVVGNTIRGHGLAANSLGTALLFRNTRGIIITDNTIIEPGYTGILGYHDNEGLVISKNTIVDPWTNAVGNGEAFGIVVGRSGYDTGIVSDNQTIRGEKSATYAASYSVGIVDPTGVNVAMSGNRGGETHVYKGGSGYDTVDLGVSTLKTTGAATVGSLTSTADATVVDLHVTDMATLDKAVIGGGSPGELEVRSTAVLAGAAAAQIIVRGADAGYGAGVRFRSKETGDDTVLDMAAIIADGEDTWDGPESASSYLRVYTGLAGVLSEQWRWSSIGDYVAKVDRNLRMPVGDGVVQTGRGPTTDRPAAASAGQGAMWFDTTLGKPIWSTGSVWVDSGGVTV